MYTVTGTPSHSTKLLFDVFVPSFRVTMMQRIMSFNETFLGEDNEMQRSTTSDDDIISFIELFGSGIRLIVSKEFQSTVSSLVSFQCNFEGLTSSLSTAVVYLSPERSKVETEITLLLNVEFGPTEASLYNNNGSLKLDSIFILFSKIMPQMTIATLDYISHCLSRLSLSIKNGSNRQRASRQKLIIGIVHFLSGKPTMDFLSTIQPSFLVQSDDPGRLRQDLNWKFLFQLRDALRYLEEESYKALYSSFEFSESTLYFSDVEEALNAPGAAVLIDGEKLSLSKLTILKELFDRPVSLANDDFPSSNTFLADSVFFDLGVLEVEYQDGIVQLRNLFRTGYMSARIDTLNRQVQLLTPVNSSYPRSPVELPRDRSANKIENCMAVLTFGDIHLDISPNFVGLLQHIDIIQKDRKSKLQKNSFTADSSFKSPLPKSRVRLLELTISVRELLLCISSNQFTVELYGNNISSSTIIQEDLSEQDGVDKAFNQALIFDEFSVKAREGLPAAISSPNNSSVLAAVVANYGLLSFVHQRDAGTRSIVHLGSIRARAPRSALHLYHSLEAWEDDYNQTGFNKILRSFTLVSHEPTTSSYHPLQFQFSLTEASISLQIMHGTWLSWQIKNVLTYSKSMIMTDGLFSYAFDVEALLQTVAVTSSVPDPQSLNSISITPLKPTKLKLPPIRISGSYYNRKIEALALFDILHIRFSPAHWDRLLSVQQKFGSDFQDLIVLIAETRRRRSTATIKSNSQVNELQLLSNISGRWKGFHVALPGPSSTQFLECQDIDGTLSNLKGKEWAIECSDLAASFTPESIHSRSVSPSERSKRAAFMTLDIKVRGGDAVDLTNMTEKRLDITISRMNAVMHPSSIGELGDFVDHLQVKCILISRECILRQYFLGRITCP